MNPIFSNTEAFAPFADTSISYCGVRPGGRTIRGSVMASVLDNGFDEIFDENGVITGSRIRKISVRFPKKDAESWMMKDRPQVGDELTLACGVSFAVTSIDIFDVGEWILEARQK